MYDIIKTTPTAIVVKQGDKLVKIQGESFARGYGSPDFIISVDSIKNWILGDRVEAIALVERDAIVSFVLTELSAKGWEIIAE